MRAIFIAIAALACVEAAIAETPRPAKLIVGVSDLDLTSASDVKQLTQRMIRRIWAICGHPTQAGLTYANTGKGLEERAACIAETKLPDGYSAPIKAAFEEARKLAK